MGCQIYAGFLAWRYNGFQTFAQRIFCGSDIDFGWIFGRFGLILTPCWRPDTFWQHLTRELRKMTLQEATIHLQNWLLGWFFIPREVPKPPKIRKIGCPKLTFFCIPFQDAFWSVEERFWKDFERAWGGFWSSFLDDFRSISEHSDFMKNSVFP